MYSWHKNLLEELRVSSGKPGQAQLWISQPGDDLVGLAIAYAQLLLCETPLPDHAACGQCKACLWVQAGNHPDMRRLQPLAQELANQGVDDEAPQAPAADEAGGKKASDQIRIDQVRALDSFFSIGGHRGSRRVVVVDPAHRLNVEAANALLKILEEPPAGMLFLLLTDAPHLLPATVRSRCVSRSVPGPSREQLHQWLMTQYGLEPAQAEHIVGSSYGQVSLAMHYADPAMAALYRQAVELISRVPDTDAIKAGEQLQAIAPVLWVPLLVAWCEDLMAVCHGLPGKRFPSQAGRIKDLARGIEPWRLAGFCQWLQREQALVRFPLNARLFTERILLQYQTVLS
jgi:DNA polymerase III subunit delta'